MRAVTCSPAQVARTHPHGHGTCSFCDWRSPMMRRTGRRRKFELWSCFDDVRASRRTRLDGSPADHFWAFPCKPRMGNWSGVMVGQDAQLGSAERLAAASTHWGKNGLKLGQPYLSPRTPRRRFGTRLVLVWTRRSHQVTQSARDADLIGPHRLFFLHSQSSPAAQTGPVTGPS